MTTPIVFADVDDDGVFGPGDIDLTTHLREGPWWVNTPHSVVVAKPLSVIDRATDWDTRRCTGLQIRSTKNITIKASIVNPGYAGSLDLEAGERIDVAPSVTLSARTQISLVAGRIIALGAKVRLYAKGEVEYGAGFGGWIGVTAPEVYIGDKLVAQSMHKVSLTASSTDLVLKPSAQIITDRLSLTAPTAIQADSVKLTGRSMISLFSVSRIGPISVCNSRLTTLKEGSILLTAPLGEVDITKAIFRGAVPQIEAAEIVR